MKEGDEGDEIKKEKGPGGSRRPCVNAAEQILGSTFNSL